MLSNLRVILSADICDLRQAWFAVQYIHKTRWYDLLLSEGLAYLMEETALEVLVVEDC